MLIFSSTVSGGHVYGENGTRTTVRHEHFDVASNVTCGVLVKNSAQASVLHSTARKPVYIGSNELPGVSSNAAFCVVSSSYIICNT